MVETSAVSYRSQCDWCGLEKEGKLSANSFSTLSIIDPELREGARGRDEEFYWLGSRADKTIDLCPDCYEPVKVFLNKMAETRRDEEQVKVDSNVN